MTVTPKWYLTLRHPKMHPGPHTKFGIPTSNNVGDMLRTNYSRNEVKVAVTQKWYACSAIPRCIHTPNLGFLPQKMLEICSVHDYSRNWVQGQGHSDPKKVSDTSPASQDASTHQIWDS